MNSKKECYTTTFGLLAIIFTVCLILSNILASKIKLIGKWSVTAGVIVFPISYIVNDLLSEVYGFQKTKRVIYLGFLMLVFMVVVFWIAIAIPSPAWFENSNAFAVILGSAPRIAVASFLAYLVGSLVNSKVLVQMKSKDKNGKKFGIRAIVSTIFGELTDSLVFVPIAFLGDRTIPQILEMIVVQVVIKTVYEIILLPITYIVVNRVKRIEG